MMKRILLPVVAFVALLVTGTAVSAEKTVTLTVDNMTCASCPYIVKQTLAKVEGVRAVEVSFEDKTAVVTFDDALADVTTLTAATADMGYPSRLARK